ncbi:hypothetical protein EWM64_g9054 [Hericium alpestre]|uniref:O-methyltransferase C-terminal domain-containing protein n=1 Tax=Hericium alpestre TaxID=135208 RepID=A0A4Y9ZLI4_9AGAM|nr:hypothetical protein EWM64_g9054 [Hericium alpestre]
MDMHDGHRSALTLRIMTTVEDIQKRKANIRALVSLISSATEEALGAWERDMGRHIRQKYPEALQRNCINFVPLNFLKEPPVPDQDIYYMRYVIHDWSDNVSTVILKNVRKAMNPSSRLLIHDFVLTIPDDRSASRSEHVNAHAQDAPHPLLPNYGAGGILPFLADIKAMVATNAKERSVEDHVDIASQADLEFVRFWDCVETSMVEFRIAQG